jgi:large-conductance mechanosensitive channel
MEFSLATLIGQIIGFLFIALVVYFVALIPISLKRIANELTELKLELRKRSKQGQ